MERKKRTHDSAKRYFQSLMLMAVMLAALLSTVAVAAGMSNQAGHLAGLPVKGAIVPGGNFTATPTETRCPQLPCDVPSATATECPNPAVGCPSATATVCVDTQGLGLCPSPTATCPAGAICETATATATCEPGHCITETPTATVCVGGNGQCASPTPTCDAGIPCPTDTKTPQHTDTSTVTATNTKPAEVTSTATVCIDATGQGLCASPTPTCDAGIPCATATSTKTPQATATPTCEGSNGQPCTTSTATPRPSFTPTATSKIINTSTSTSTKTPQVANTSTSTATTGPSFTPTSTLTRTATASPTVTCVATPPGMTHWWPLDELSGNVAFESVFGANALELNSPAHVPGKVAGALNFNGVNQWAAVVPPWNSPQLGTGDFTIDTWISIPVSSLVGTQVFLDGRNFAPRGYSMFLINGRLGLQMADQLPPPGGWTNYVAPSAGALANPGWHFVAATVRRTTGGGTLWVDGAAVLTFNPRLGNLNNNAPLWIGRHHPNAVSNTTSYFRGSLDEIEFFRRALTSAEIISIYEAGSRGKCKKEPTPPTPTKTPGPCHWCQRDVLVGSPFYLYVTNLAYQGVVGGYPCGGPNEPCEPPGNYPYYRPNANITRGQIAKIVAISAGFNDAPTGQTFTDVEQDHPFWLWIEQLSNRGLIGGYPCGGPK
ncbi:MAG: S-layer homology domain-containing protein, partial [Chloroflexota bacterium]|nr:S-layer homology domain-containing protein [Chloroflexota bacterium]